ncbi:hypothetical protein NQ315_013929 [Exocentrus adspersus]|uniref:Right handed beta helix domain-containing protein n=1 Tax=Exocentrus adspersus TaxID=1586481 RepID=A0AAV8VRH5_9CUCU|nr:hypothetical protein NQ315_013929 [Exocentrus adspersus]
MDQILTFDKSLQQRLQEFRDVLSGYEVLPSALIKKEWTFYLELTVDPIGWQAVWKIPRLKCEDLNIPFPSIVLVLVLNVEYQSLLALVRVLAVQDDITIPEKHHVPLLQLWPTEEQDNSVALNVQSTANALDMYRFFYTHVYMPWDNDEDDSVDWKSKHLESRLRLFYDLKNGIIPRATAEYIHCLLTEARRLNSKREYIESQISEDDDNVDCDDDTKDATNRNVESLMEIHVRLLEIKNEIDLFENPLFRNVVIKKQTELFTARNNKKQQIWLIFSEGTADSYIRFLEQVKIYYPSELLLFATSLAFKLETSNSRDVFILNESEHIISTTGALEQGGILKGVGSPENIILKSKSEDIILDFIGGNVLIENLTIDAKLAQCAIIVRSGTGVLKNCKIIGDGSSSTHQGIIILASAVVEIIDCEISGFCTAIVGNSGSTVLIKNSEIHDVNYGMKIYDKCIANVKKSKFHDCQQYGIVIETEDNLNIDSSKVGSFETLNIIPDMQSDCVSGSNNMKGDVIINKRRKMKPMEDLFCNPDFDPTIIEDDNREHEDDIME